MMKKTMESRFQKAEAYARLAAMVFAAMTALLVGLDTERKTVFFQQKKATVKSLGAPWVLTVIATVAMVHNLIQICKFFITYGSSENGSFRFNPSNKVIAWISFLLDQAVAYAMFNGIVVTAQGAGVALFGIRTLQWEKLCSVYTKFCVQMAFGVFFGFLDFLILHVFIASASARRLFRLYPPPHC